MFNSKISYFLGGFISIVLLISIALISIHTKIAGLAWISFILVSITVVFAKSKSIPNNKNYQLINVVKIMLTMFFIGYVLKLLVQLNFSEFNDASNFNQRMIAVLFFSILIMSRIDATCTSAMLFRLLPYSLLIFPIFALIITINYRYEAVYGTHPIPWAAGLTLLSIPLQLYMLYSRSENKLFFIVGWIVLLCLLISVLLNGKRGSYFYMIWLILYALYTLRQINNIQITFKTVLFSLFVFFGGIGVMVLVMYYSGHYMETIYNRIAIGYNEMMLYFVNPMQAANTSVGARLYMWHHAIISLDGHWFFGLGSDGVKEMISQFALDSKAPMLKGLNQLHNEYLQALTSYGVLGLISWLLYPLAFLYAAIRLRSKYNHLSFCMYGMLFLFLTASLTNTNTYHNYFSTTFSLSLGLLFIICLINEFKFMKESS